MITRSDEKALGRPRTLATFTVMQGELKQSKNTRIINILDDDTITVEGRVWHMTAASARMGAMPHIEYRIFQNRSKNAWIKMACFDDGRMIVVEIFITGTHDWFCVANSYSVNVLAREYRVNRKYPAI